MSVLSTRRRLAAAGAISGLLAAPLAVVAGATAAHAATPVDITILGTNDFHGRLLPDRDIPGAAKYAGAVKQLESENPNTIFAAAGDLIGATTFDSFIAQDKPTIDVLNEMGLDVSAVGDHELDKGWDDLTKRVMQPESESNPRGGAAWEYIVANLSGPAGEEDLIEDSWTTEVEGVTVGFVGAVTEDLPTLVTPAGIEGVTIEDVVSATNREADRLTTEAGADVVVLLVHEGGTDCTSIEDNPDSKFGTIVTGVNGNVDAIVSGHTHEDYSCSFPVAEWASDASRVVKERPVVSAGQYGAFLDKLDLTVDSETGTILSMGHELVDVFDGEFPEDPAVAQIVADAQAAAEGPGSQVLGAIDQPLYRARKADGDENRGGESKIGNFVAEVQQWATQDDTFGGAQIAFMNPGGLREDLVDEAVTYRAAANVQPYANTLVNMDLKGRQIRKVLEEQWQPEGASRPFLRLGVSEGFTYNYDPKAEAGQRIKTMRLFGKRIFPRRTYSVTLNSFLASGGDNFGTFETGRNVRDTGQTDLEAMVNYLDAVDPAAETVRQQAFGIHWRTDNIVRPRARRVVLKVSSFAFTGPEDVQDSKVIARLGKRRVGKFRLDNTIAPLDRTASAYDETGQTVVRFRVPRGVKPGRYTLKLRGNRTGSFTTVPVRVTRR